MSFCERCGMESAWCVHGRSEPFAPVGVDPGFWQRCLDLVLEGEQDGGPAVTARYSGTCPLCGLRWEPGELIAMDQDEDSWVHAECTTGE